jgi:MFS family permease
MSTLDFPNGNPVAGGRAPAPTLTIASVILSMSLLAVGNGLLFAYVPVRLGHEGFPPFWAGAILTALSAGGMVGCFLAGALVRRLGHARTFMALVALILLSNVLVATGTDPMLWLASRTLYGFAINGLFIVSQSWLNDAVGNAIRGRVMAAFYICYIVGLGLGSMILGFVPIATPAAPLVAVLFAFLSIIPIVAARPRQPAPPEAASISFAKAWAISPVGVAGMLASGGLSMMVAGFTPIHATASGFSQSDVSILMVSMQLGTILFQLPFGWLSDNTDRRYVLIGVSALVAIFGILAAQAQDATYLLIVVIFVIWSGVTESIYSISSAHANDRAEPQDLVTLTSTMLFSWSLAGFVAPGLATLLTVWVGTQAFMGLAVAIALVFCLFVAWRILAAPPPLQSASFAPMSAQAPLPADLAFPSEEPGPAEEFRETKNS